MSYEPRLAIQVGDAQEAMQALGNQHVVRLHLMDLDAALAGLEENRALTEKQGSREGLICNYINLARCLAHLGREEEALALSRRALALAQETDSSAPMVISLRSLAERLPPDQQEPLLQEALHLAREAGRKLDEAVCLLSLAALKDGAEQDALWKQGARLLRKIGAAAWLEGHSPQNPPQIMLLT